MSFQYSRPAVFAVALGLTLPISSAGCRTGSQTAIEPSTAPRENLPQDKKITFEGSGDIILESIQLLGAQPVLDMVDDTFTGPTEYYRRKVAKMSAEDLSTKIMPLLIPVGVDASFFGHPELHDHYLRMAQRRAEEVDPLLNQDFTVHYCEIRTMRGFAGSSFGNTADYGLYLFCAVTKGQFPQGHLVATHQGFLQKFFIP